MAKRNRTSYLDRKVKRLYTQVKSMLVTQQIPFDNLADLSILLFKLDLMPEPVLNQVEKRMIKVEQVIALSNSSPYAGEVKVCKYRAHKLCHSTLELIEAKCNLALLVAMDTNSLKVAVNTLMKQAERNPEMKAMINKIITQLYGAQVSQS